MGQYQDLFVNNELAQKYDEAISNINKTKSKKVSTIKYRKETHAVKKLFSLWYIPVFLFILTLIGKEILFAGIILLMFVSAFIVGTHKSYLKASVGVELITIYSLILTLAVSLKVGIIFLITTQILVAFKNDNFCGFLFVKLFTYSLLCVIGSLMSGLHFLIIGKAIIILRNVIFVGITHTMNPNRVGHDLPFNFINIVTNFMFLSTVGFWLFNILQTF